MYPQKKPQDFTNYFSLNKISKDLNCRDLYCMGDGYYCSGCYYPRDYQWLAYPLSSFPHGGVFNKLPDFYQDYEKERRRAQAEFRKAQEKKEQDRWRDFAKKFTQGFFGFSEATPKQSNDYPYCVFGLKRSASDEDMKKAYRKSVLKAHPDRGGTNAAFRKVREAWEYFKNYLGHNP